jgi:uncharacterized membrane protein YkvA (DUF1232 family)
MARKGFRQPWYLFFKRALSRAGRIIKDPKALHVMLQEAATKLEKYSKILPEVLDDFRLIFRLIRAWIAGEYKDIPIETVILLIGAVIYFLMPIDAFPDFVPVAGFLDDAAVLAWTITVGKNEIDKFRAWESVR